MTQDKQFKGGTQNETTLGAIDTPIDKDTQTSGTHYANGVLNNNEAKKDTNGVIKMKNAKQNKNGFTLIEILIVVVIIGLLAAIGIPALANARSKSADQARMANARIVDVAVARYTLENGESLSISQVELAPYIRGTFADMVVGKKYVAPGTTFSSKVVVTESELYTETTP